jgi:hypothetical protein
MNKLELINEQKNVLIKLNTEIRDKERTKVNYKNTVEEKINTIRNDTDFVKVLNKPKPTIKDIDSFVENNKDIKDLNNKINRCQPAIDCKKRLFNIEMEYFKLLGEINE